MKLPLFLFAYLFMFCSSAIAENYPDQGYPEMVGVWTGHIRTVSSGEGVSSQVARGGTVIAEIDMKVTIEHQDGETFMGHSRNSSMSKNDRSVPVWGAIRSDGSEALFVSGGGGRGNLWFVADDKFEFCLTSLANDVLSAYCGVLKKGGE